MSFAAPWRLVMIAAPLALLASYVVVQRRRRKYAVRFTSVDLLASVAPRRPGWQRHVSAVVMLCALGALVVGLARPVKVSKVPRQRGTILLAIDTSGSMSATDVVPTRLAAAEDAARKFVTGIPSGMKVGLLSFSNDTRIVVAPTSDHSQVLGAFDSLTVSGGTATAAAINQALSSIAALPKGADGKKAPAAIVLMSDGAPTIGVNGAAPIDSALQAAAAAKQAGVPIDTIAFGTPNGTVQVQGETVPVPADPETMAKIASTSGGKSFTATTGTQLRSVYEQIRRSVGYDTVTRDITMWFLALGLLLGTLAAAAGIFWMQRIP
ncbi:MAG TPA: VWA domain-containing protein [Acidimicrobiia bacterium]|nr:VWA domain-containing protein [Acidimicrobiia bacterium]